MILKQTPSANWNHRPIDPSDVDCIVLHATADRNTMASVDWCRTGKPKNPNPVSYHVIVDRDGAVFVLVNTEHRAWHAGVSSFRGRANCNDYSIGLSFANDNAGEPYTDVQLAVAAALCAIWMKKHPKITRDRITTHKAVALPPGRKTDPAHFDLDHFLTLVDAECAR